MNKHIYYNFKHCMRISAYIMVLQFTLFSAVLASSGAAQTKPLDETYVTIQVQNVKLKEALHTIEGQTEYTFGFDQSIAAEGRVTLYKERASVKDVLVEISKQTRVNFRRINNYIDVKQAKNEKAQTKVREIRLEN